ncbi:BQ5605_C004g02854 [Microbotryum silenes-dioicae]|uniref:mannan endo-1,4-beta-mannosidase n=1 Tax=Microbotryum silenes-dioicae TaxID=796604 RepID=A0A2X0N320_9BASI|nr:BQ5605_C004g02854 [Microbotryum silenes-dioicae]
MLHSYLLLVSILVHGAAASWYEAASRLDDTVQPWNRSCPRRVRAQAELLRGVWRDSNGDRISFDLRKRNLEQDFDFVEPAPDFLGLPPLGTAVSSARSARNFAVRPRATGGQGTDYLGTAPINSSVSAVDTIQPEASIIIDGPPASFQGSGSYLEVDPSGTGLTLDGEPFRPVGPRLCNDESLSCLPRGYYTDKSRIREALAAAVAMGANTIRLNSCGISTGFPQAVQPSLHTYGTDEQLDIHDYVIYAAGEYGLKVILPLTDNYDYYHGGKYTFLRWLNVPTDNAGAQFFTDRQVRRAFKRYIKFLLTRVNQYNGLAYGEDPTIAIIEDGNEFGAYMGKEGFPPLSFTEDIAKYVKSLAPQALLMDGTDGFYNYTTKAVAPGVTSPYVDIVTDHAYPRNIALLKRQVDIAHSNGKVFLIGEMDWTPNNGGADFGAYLNLLYNYQSVGVMAWSLFTHDTPCSSYVIHDDAYSIYYPNGPNTSAERSNILKLVQFWYQVTGRDAPSSLPQQTATRLTRFNYNARSMASVAIFDMLEREMRVLPCERLDGLDPSRARPLFTSPSAQQLLQLERVFSNTKRGIR